MLTDDEVDDRLYAWAQWAREDIGPGGFAPESILYRVMRYGAQSAHRGDGLKLEGEHPQEEQMEECVKSLRPSLREVVIIQYFMNAPKDQKARKAKISVREFYRRLRSAKEYIAGWLSAREKTVGLSAHQCYTTV